MKVFVLSILLCFSLVLRAQQYTNGLPITGQNVSQAYYHDQQIIIKARFTSADGFSAVIKPYVNANVLELDKRSVMSHLVRIPGLKSHGAVGSAASGSVVRSYTFFDAFERVGQTVMKDFHGLGTDLVQPLGYEMAAVSQKNYLPYTVAYNGNSYRAHALHGTSGYGNSEQRAYYLSPPQDVAGAGTNGNAFSEVRLEDFGGRPLEQAGPGEHHKLGSGHTVGNTYSFNAANGLRKWVVTTTGVTASGFYDPAVNTIHKMVTVDGDGQTGISYKDVEGKLLASSRMLSGTPLTTYYVYDVFDRLAYVIPPLPAELGAPAAINNTDEVFKNFVYAYRYDKHGRTIEKHVPAQGWTVMVYNKCNQLILTQNAVQQGQGKWAFVKYDANDRAVYSGIYISTSSRETLQAAATSYTGALYESATPATGMGYTDNSFPIINSATGSEVYAYNYYDSYAILANTNVNNATSSGIFKLPDVDTLQKTPHGMAMASLKKVVGTADYLLSVMYYDHESRLVQLSAQNYYANRKHANNYDVATTVYNFGGTVHKTTSIQSVDATTPLLTKLETFNSYDHHDRPLEISQRINEGAITIIERYEYNAIGQLVKKKVHSSNNGVDFLQHFNQKYDVAGQLNSVNNPQTLVDEDDPTKTDVFAFKLHRETVGSTGATPRYNGNISAVSWQTKVPSLLAGTITQDEKTFAYSYDQLGRLTDAQFKTAAVSNSFREQLGYDELGNITSLTRKGKTGNAVNQLSYNYGSSIRRQQLQSVTDTGSEGHTGSYSYDVTGRLKSDGYRQANDIVYNDMDMVATVALSGSRNISYLYDAGGSKLYRETSSASGIDKQYYVNGNEYDTNGNLLFIRTFFGRLVPNGSGGFTYEYFIRDHLGNMRGIYADRNNNHQVDADEISDVADYYPFGKTLGYGGSLVTNPLNSYGFGEKEKQPMTDYLDFHARQYEVNIARWLSVDPLAEKMRRFSPYNYAFNNPIRFIDPDGMDPRDTDNNVDEPDFYNEYRMLNDAQDDPDGYTIKSTDEGFNDLLVILGIVATEGAADKGKKQDDPDNGKKGKQANNNKGAKPLTHAEELAKYGQITGFGSVSISVAYFAGLAYENGIVETDKGWLQRYQSVYSVAGVGVSGGTNGGVIIARGSSKPTFSDWKGLATGGSVSYLYFGAAVGVTSNYYAVSGNFGLGYGVKSNWNGSFAYANTFLIGNPYPKPAVDFTRHYMNTQKYLGGQ